jgi:hypothetical protein
VRRGRLPLTASVHVVPCLCGDMCGPPWWSRLAQQYPCMWQLQLCSVLLGGWKHIKCCPVASRALSNSVETLLLHLLRLMHAHGTSQAAMPVTSLLSCSPAAVPPPPLFRVKAMRTGLERKESCWWVLRLFNMSTITREWVALQHSHLVPFSDLLVSGQARELKASRHMDIPAGMKVGGALAAQAAAACAASHASAALMPVVQHACFVTDDVLMLGTHLCNRPRVGPGVLVLCCCTALCASHEVAAALLLQTVIERQCNASQMQALQAGLEGNPLVLIQVGAARRALQLAPEPALPVRWSLHSTACPAGCCSLHCCVGARLL